MAVLIEGVCLLLRCDTIARLYPGGVAGLAEASPAEAICADEELLAPTFEDSDAAEDFLAELAVYGVRHLIDDMAADAVLADPFIGPVSPCGWAEYARVAVGGQPDRQVGACGWPGSDMAALQVPVGWRFEGSQSEQLALCQPDDDESDAAEEPSAAEPTDW